MSPSTATLHIAPIESSIEKLEAAILTGGTAAEVSRCALEAAAAVVPCSGGAILLGSGSNDELEVASTSASESYPLGSRHASKGRAPKGALRFPLRFAGADFGQIVLLDAKAPRAERKQMLDRALTLAAVLGPIIETDALREQLVESHAMVQVGQVLTGLLAMDDVLSYVVYLAESLVRGNSATIALLSPDKNSLVLKNSTGVLRDLEGKSIPADSSLIGWVIRKGQPVVTRNISDDPRSFALSSRQGPGLVVPIHINGETIGGFLVGRVEGALDFTDEDVATLQQMAAYAAIAINNAQLYHEQTAAANALREQARELQEAYGELNKQQEQLVVSEKMAALGRITAGIAHEINSPLASIMNALRTTRTYVEEYQASTDDPEITPEDHTAIAIDMLGSLTLAEGAASKVAQFVRSIKTQTRPGEGQLTTFDPAAEVDSTVVLLKHRLKKENVGLYTEMETGLALTGDQGKFALVVQNLVGNAIDAYEGEAGEVWIRLHASDDSVVLEVEDRGCGIPENIRGRIFDYLFTTKDVGKGTGLGLAMVHSVVTTDFGGSLELDSEVGRGTTFRLLLPIQRTEG